MKKVNVLKYNGLIKAKVPESISLPRHKIRQLTVNKRVIKVPITQSRVIYTEPYIYYGCSNRGNTGKIRKNIKKDWYVMYRYRNPDTGDMEPFCIKGGINEAHTIGERTLLAEALRDELSSMLSQGFNPFAKTIDEIGTGRDILRMMPLNRALLYAYDKHKVNLARRTRIEWGGKDDQSGMLRRLLIGISLTNNDLAVSEIRRFHVIQILDKVQAHYKLSNTRWNNFLSIFSALLGRLVIADILDFNPANKIERRKKARPRTHTPPTTDEKERIVACLKKKHYRLYLVAKIVFRTGTRPDEILGIREDHFHYKEGLIKLEPEQVTSKKKERFVPIDEELAAELQALETPRGYYIFGTYPELLPSNFRMHKNRLHDIWRKVIKTELGINRTLYSLKHRGGNERRRMGSKVEDEMNRFGHTSKKMTEIYLTEEDELKFEQMRKYKPSF